MLFIQYISGFIIFFAVVAAAWYVTEKRVLIPSFLDYQPWNCKKCLSFWTGIAVSVGLFILGWWVCGLTLAMLSSANAAAVVLDEKKNGIQL